MNEHALQPLREAEVNEAIAAAAALLKQYGYVVTPVATSAANAAEKFSAPQGLLALSPLGGQFGLAQYTPE